MHGVGIIGAGSVAGGHLRAVAALESTHLQAVADTDAERSSPRLRGARLSGLLLL